MERLRIRRLLSRKGTLQRAQGREQFPTGPFAPARAAASSGTYVHAADELALYSGEMPGDRGGHGGGRSARYRLGRVLLLLGPAGKGNRACKALS